jgi:hypothetical protein
MHQQLINKLNDCPTGAGQSANNYEDIVADIFNFLFCPEHIDEPRIQTITYNPDRRRDIILPIACKEGLFYLFALHFKNDTLLVECKNYKDEVTHREIFQICDYLDRPSLAKIAFLVTRKGMTKNASDTIKEKISSTRKTYSLLNRSGFNRPFKRQRQRCFNSKKKYHDQKLKY